MDAAVPLNGAVHLSWAVQLNGAVLLSGTAQLNGTAQLSGTAQLNVTAQLSGAVVPSAAGAARAGAPTLDSCRWDQLCERIRHGSATP